MIDASGADPHNLERKGRIEIVAYAKIKQLRQAIKDDLGIKDKLNVRLILPIDKEAQKDSLKEETKEGDEPVEVAAAASDATETVIPDDKLSLKEAGILDQGDKLQVEVFIKVAIDVQGKGKDYSAILEVSPDDLIQPTLQQRLSFFKTFF